VQVAAVEEFTMHLLAVQVVMVVEVTAAELAIQVDQEV